MAVKLSSLKVDEEKSQEGVWIEYAEGLEFKVARTNNPAFRKYIASLQRPYQRQLRRGDVELTLKLARKAVARHVLLGWRGLVDDGGNEIPYSVEKAEEILEIAPDVYEFVDSTSTDADLFKEEIDEESEKNSPSGSNGT